MAEAHFPNPSTEDEDEEQDFPPKLPSNETPSAREPAPKTVLVIALNGVEAIEAIEPDFWMQLKRHATVIFTQDCNFLSSCLSGGSLLQAITTFQTIIIADNALYMNYEIFKRRSPGIIQGIRKYMKEGGTVVMGFNFAQGVPANWRLFEKFLREGLGFPWVYDEENSISEYDFDHDTEFSIRVNVKLVNEGRLKNGDGKPREMVIPRANRIYMQAGTASSYSLKQLHHAMDTEKDTDILWQYLFSDDLMIGYDVGLGSPTSILLCRYGKGLVGYVGVVGSKKKKNDQQYSHQMYYYSILAMCGSGLMTCGICKEDVEPVTPETRKLCCVNCRLGFCSDTCQLAGAMERKV